MSARPHSSSTLSSSPSDLHSVHLTRKTLAIAVQGALLIATLTAFAVLPARAADATPSAATKSFTSKSYQIASGALGPVLGRFAAAAGVALSFDPAVTAGLNSPGVQGSYAIDAAFNAVLSGTGLQAVDRGNGEYTLRKLPAQSNVESTLPTVTVTGANATGALEVINGYVAKRGITGSKTDTPLLETPQSISVIGSQEIEDKGMLNLTDALAQTPGVTVNPYGFDSRALDWVLLRGFDGWYSSSYRDGLLQTPGLSFLGVQTEVYGLERLEVLRGPSSVLYGKGDVGGVVNRVSKLPRADAPREISVRVGSYDRKQVSFDVGGALDSDDKLLYRLVGLGLDTGTQDKYPNGKRMDQEREYFAPSLRWQLSPQTALTLQAEHLRDDSSDDVQFVTGANGLPTNVKEGDPTYSRIKTGSDSIGYQFEHQAASGWLLQQKGRYAYRTSDKHHIQSFLIDAVTLGRQARYDDESVSELTIDTSAQRKLQTGEISQTVLVGIDWSRSTAEWRQLRAVAPNLSLTNPVYGVNIPEPNTLRFDTQMKNTQLGLYAQDQIKFGPHWGLTLGLRHDKTTSDTHDRVNAVKATQDDNATTGRVGLNYLVGNGWSPYISYAESFVPNVGVDADGATFKPSDGKQVEVGIKYIPSDLPISFGAAIFNLEKTNVVTYDASFDARQVGKVRSRGLELEAKADLSKQLRMTAAFTMLDMKVLNSANAAEVGNMPILTPEQNASLWLDYSFAGNLQGVSVGSGLRYIGKRWNDVANTSSEPSYTLVDVSARYDTGPWRFSINIGNLFDREYLSGRAYGSYFRGAERNMVATARYQF